MMTFLYITYVLSAMFVSAMALRDIVTIRETKKIRTLASSPFYKKATKGDFIARIIGWLFITYVPPFNFVFALVEILDISVQRFTKTKFAGWWKKAL